MIMPRAEHEDGCGRRWLAVVAIWTCAIWGHSLLPADKSAAESLWVMEWLAPVLAAAGISPDIWHVLIRKMAHMTEFALLGIFRMHALKGEKRPGARALPALNACLLTALADETIQLFVPGRDGAIRDVWIDVGGAAIGIGLVCAWYGVMRRRRAGASYSPDS